MAQKSTKKGTTKKETTKTVKKTTTKKQVKKVTPKKETIKKEEPKKVVKVEEPVVEVKEEIKEEKKTIFTKRNIIILVAIIVVINIVVAAILIYNNPKNKITRRMKEMGKDFYASYLYETLKEGRTDKELSEVLAKYKDTGIKINLRNLAQYDSGKYKEEIDTFKSDKKECSKNNTRVIIYPKSPYKKSDYKIKIELDCGF